MSKGLKIFLAAAAVTMLSFGLVGLRYYNDNKRINFVYSEDTSLWHKEDEISFLSFASMGESLYGLKNDGEIISFILDIKTKLLIF